MNGIPFLGILPKSCIPFIGEINIFRSNYYYLGSGDPKLKKCFQKKHFQKLFSWNRVRFRLPNSFTFPGDQRQFPQVGNHLLKMFVSPMNGMPLFGKMPEKCLPFIGDSYSFRRRFPTCGDCSWSPGKVKKMERRNRM